ncbi:uncharacterized protein A1O5_10011 [Cladophialophora psammophila CBS 110553]|uniref:Cytochrome P450 oxidoreductase n=1 Tax=Cladophialophora psammophila CBS 110553 TaxID=1182543 RepID=W9WQ75_9EURO|nr:uncharacterized protein A1O5_10011 [Cladophialophora psammophila CBS 110553]EXJ66816.1 hypothetical protein A1O5_10011 [Cladophialophora psammophila CBS 110553]
MFEVQHKLHRRYGPLIRIAPNKVSCSGPETIKLLYRTAAPLTKTDFYPVWGNPRMSKYRDNFSQVDERLHSERRRIVNHVCSLSNVLQSEASIDRVITVMVEKLSQMARSGRDCDLGASIQWYTFDVIGELFSVQRDKGEKMDFSIREVEKEAYIVVGVFLLAWFRTRLGR